MNKFREVGYEIGNALFNPLSPIMILIVGALINKFNSISDENPIIVNWILKNLTSQMAFWIIMFWLISTVLYSYHIGRIKQYEIKLIDKESEIRGLNKELDKKDRAIEYNSGIIINRYSELAKFNKQQKFQSLIEKFVNLSSMVQAAQVYQYSSNLVDNKYLRYRVDFLTGYAYENVEINSILQNYYNIPYELKKMFDEILKLIQDSYIQEFESSITVEILYNEIEEKTVDLIGKILDTMSKLRSKSEDERLISSKISDLYRLLSVLIALVQDEESSGVSIDLSHVGLNENDILKLKRTGILGSMLLRDHYVFKHNGHTHKNGRLYVSYHANVLEEDYIFLFSIPGEMLENESDDELWYNVVKEVTNSFTYIIENEF